MLELAKRQISKAMNKYVAKFTPKYRAFSILQNNIADVVKKSTQMWKLIYGLKTIKQGEEDPFEGNNDDKEENDKEDDKEEENIVEEENEKKDNDTTTIEQ